MNSVTIHRMPKGSSALPSGTLLQGGRYRIEQTLGQGGFAITYLAQDIALHRPVAIKELLPDGCTRDTATLTVQPQRLSPDLFDQIRQRFLEEARLLAQLNHPGIVRVYDVFEAHNTGYLVMEYLQGQTLAELLRARGGVMVEAEAVGYILQLCDALQRVHQRGYLHCNIKPSNIIVTHEGRAVLIDFGAARAFAAGQTQMHTIALTPSYAPLEQYSALGRFDARTDIYALGATLYHLVTGKPPLPAPDRAQGLPLPAPHQVEPRVSEPLSRAIVHALGLRMEERPASVAVWADELRRVVHTADVAPTQAVSSSRRARRIQLALSGRRRVVVLLTGVLVLTLAALGGWFLWINHSERIAVQSLNEALQAALQIRDFSMRAVALREIAKAQAKAGLYDAALQTATQIEYDWSRAEVLRAIAKAQAQAGLYDAALQTATQIADANWRAEVLRRVAEAQAKAGLYDAAHQTATQIADANWRAEVLRRVAEAQAKAGLYDAAHQTATQIEIDSYRALALAAIAEAQAKAGLMAKAQQTVAQAYQTATQIEDDWYRAEALAAIAKAQARAGQAREAFRWASQMIDPVNRAFALIGVAQGALGIEEEQEEQEE